MQITVYWLDGSMATKKGWLLKEEIPCSGQVRGQLRQRPLRGRMVQQVRNSVCGSSWGASFGRGPYQQMTARL